MKYNRRYTVMMFVAFLVTCQVFFYTFLYAATSPWTQTDWSGGVASGTVDETATTYASQTDMDTSILGEISLATRSGWASGFEEWGYRSLITITNYNTETVTNYQVRIEIDHESAMQSDFDDIRFTTDDGSELDYWIYQKTDGISAVVYVKIPQLIGNDDTEIYLYFGNESVSSEGERILGSSSAPAETCNQIYRKMQEAPSGLYFVDPDGDGLNVKEAYCDMNEESSSGWMLIMNYEHYGGTNPSVGPTSTFPSMPNGDIDISGLLALGGNGELRHVDIISQYGFTNISAVRLYGATSGHGRIVHYHTSNATVIASVQNTSSAGASHLKSSVVKFSDHTAYLPDVASKQTNGDSNQLFGYGFPMYRGGQNHWATRGGNTRWEMDDYPSGYQNTTIHRAYTRSATSEALLVSAIEVSLDIPQSKYPSTTSLTSNILDSGSGGSFWGNLSYSVSGSGTTEVRIRTAENDDMSGALDFSTCDTISSSSDISSNNCVTDGHRYLQYEITLEPDGVTSPIFEEITLVFAPYDLTPPSTNASNARMYKNQGGDELSTNDWANNNAPYFSWTAGEDDPTSTSGLKGYCLYLGTDSEGNPETSKGLLGTSPVSTSGTTCNFITEDTSIDFATLSYRGSPWITSSTDPYYLNIKAIDNAGLVFTGDAEQFQFRFDNTLPTNPSYISLPSDFVSSKDVTMTWPTFGSSQATDAHSDIAGLQYRIGNPGTWYGDDHLGSEDLDDLLINDGGYTMNETTDYPNLEEGDNTLYVRTWDHAGNVSTIYTTGAIKINSTAPSTPIDLTVNPDDATTNAYSFDWDVPATFLGTEDNITYCYTINTLPSVSSCVFTDAGDTSLEEDAYATQPGENTLYLVAKDEAGNINYDTAANVTFTYSGSAPGIPTGMDIADISVKATESWKLALSWEEPDNVGAGVEQYRIYRSTTDSNYQQVATSLDISYVDTNLDQQIYYYKVKACDSANTCGAFSQGVSLYPDGKFIEPASLLSGPTISNITTKRAVVSWTTNRTSDSRVQFGKNKGEYYDEEPSKSEQITDHQIELSNLSAGTRYYYRTRWTDEDGNTGVSDEKSFQTDSAPILSGVSVSSLGIDTTTIQFTTENASAAKVYYGESTSFGGLNEIDLPISKQSHQMTFSGLSDNTTYYYKIMLIDEEDEEYDNQVNEFTTLPRPRVSGVRIEQVREAPEPTIAIFWQTNTEVSSVVNYYPQNNPGASQDKVDLERKSGEHQVLISGLNPETVYTVIAKGTDAYGNEAVSDLQTVTTDTDTRSPKISDLRIEGVSKTTADSDEAQSQFVVTWKTDEPSTSQVEFGEGSSGAYQQSTQKDENLTESHLVIVSGLTPSRVYHLRALSADTAGNTGSSIDTIAVAPKATSNALDLVVKSLSELFGMGR